MTLPVQITYRNAERSERIEAKIREEAAKLDKFYSHIMSCRVMVEAPEHRRRYGGMHHVRIDLGVPGGELVIRNEPNPHGAMQQTGDEKAAKHLEIDVPHKEVVVAIHDAFRAARRQLQDYSRRQRGDTKTHLEQKAQVFEVYPQKGYGFLETADGRQVYFHKNSVLHGSFGRIKAGATVSFTEEQGDHGPQASTVRIVR